MNPKNAVTVAMSLASSDNPAHGAIAPDQFQNKFELGAVILKDFVDGLTQTSQTFRCIKLGEFCETKGRQLWIATDDSKKLIGPDHRVGIL